MTYSCKEPETSSYFYEIFKELVNLGLVNERLIINKILMMSLFVSYFFYI